MLMLKFRQAWTAPCSSEEFQLVKTLAVFPDKIMQALEDLEPSVITRYLVDVAQNFNRFYHEHPILVEDRAVRKRLARLRLPNQAVKRQANRASCAGGSESGSHSSPGMRYTVPDLIQYYEIIPIDANTKAGGASLKKLFLPEGTAGHVIKYCSYSRLKKQGWEIHYIGTKWN